MEKIGGIVGSEGLVEKGRARRESLRDGEEGVGDGVIAN